MRAVLIAAALVAVAGIAAPAMGAQLIASVNPGAGESEFNMRYLSTVSVQYPDGGQVADLLRGHQAQMSAFVAAGTPESEAVAEMITATMLANGSQARVQDIDVEYTATLQGRQDAASIDYKVEIDGTLAGYVIRPLEGSNPAVVDMGWRDMSVSGPVMLGGTEINIPMSFIEAEVPELARAMSGSGAEALLRAPLMDSSFILEQPLTNWHSLFDPTGLNVDAAQFGISDAIAGFVVTGYTMGESSIREGRQIETILNAPFSADREYNVKATQSADNGNIGVIGFSQLDSIDGLEIVGVFPAAPANTADTSTGDFPVFIMYGMAGGGCGRRRGVLCLQQQADEKGAGPGPDRHRPVQAGRAPDQRELRGLPHQPRRGPARRRIAVPEDQERLRQPRGGPAAQPARRAGAGGGVRVRRVRRDGHRVRLPDAGLVPVRFFVRVLDRGVRRARSRVLVACWE